jgi:AAHS family 4-hydroxybenzoate transporter-like MFS transporter
VLDVGPLLDGSRWSAYQKAVTLLAALAVTFDGFDIQILAFAIPSIMREWHVARSAFAPVAALGLAGMAVGSPLAGYCGDRLGRRLTLIGCVLVFGLATIATAFAHTLTELGILRTIAGIGVGGALPNASALTAEFAPLRRRAMAVTLTIVCVPLGGMVAGLVAAQVLPAMGWRALYLIGGAAPLLYALVLLVALPESPRFLARHAERTGELIRILWRMGHTVAEDTIFSGGPEWEGKAGSLAELFAPGLLRDTIGLWIAFFASLVGQYLVLGWLPAMLSAQGLDIRTASSGLAAYNFGGVLGVLLCAAIITTIGSRRPMLSAAIGGGTTALALMFVRMGPADGYALLIAGFALTGFFLHAVQTTMFALASHVYPTRVRASGVACAAATGRVGGMLSSFAGAAIIQAGSRIYLLVLAGATAVTFVGLAIVRNHYPGRRDA